MEEAEDLNPSQSEFESQEAHMIETMVKNFVGSRGYGPWYQYDAWETISHWSITQGPNVFLYLDERYPRIKLGE